MTPFFILRNFINALLKEKSPGAIGAAAAFGFILGIIPKNNLTAHLLFILAFVFKTNIPFFFISTIFFSSISFLVDKITDPVGYCILTSNWLYPLFRQLYNTVIIPWTDFNNTVVIGGVFLGLIVFYPIYYFFKKIAERYLLDLGKKISQMRVIRLLRLSWLFEWYFKD
ncbi:MAG: TIGR03546 family protein [Elusimicrobiales bacterium]